MHVLTNITYTIYKSFVTLYSFFLCSDKGVEVEEDILCGFVRKFHPRWELKSYTWTGMLKREFLDFFAHWSKFISVHNQPMQDWWTNLGLEILAIKYASLNLVLMSWSLGVHIYYII